MLHRRIFLSPTLLSLLVLMSISAAAETARGVVYHDKNENGVRDAREKGMADVRVSNGAEIVLTNRRGEYEISVTDDCVIFVIKPRNWTLPVDDKQLPQFSYIHKPKGSPKLRFPGTAPTGSLPESVDFPLTKKREPNEFKAIFFGDTQTTNQAEIDYVAHDILEELVGTDALFGVTLGDVVNNDLSHSEPLARSVSMVGIPWHNVLGNHDENYDVTNDADSDEAFTRVYGAPYYAFDYGPVHFIAMDDVYYDVDKYHAEIAPRQMEFLKNDLALIDKDQLVVMMMHIPMYQITNKAELFALMQGHNIFSVSAHFHTQRHYFYGEKDGWLGEEPHHHMIHGTACGSWWTGLKDERGIPHTTMADGIPNGYSVFTFDGEDFSIEYKAASRPANYQMAIDTPEEIAQADLAKTNVMVNVFNGSERSTTTMQIDDSGEWLPMAQTDAEDPYAKRSRAYEAKLPEGFSRKLSKVAGSNHFWKAPLPAGLAPGAHRATIKTTDMHGKTYTATRIFRVK
jgi:hypothetical protein